MQLMNVQRDGVPSVSAVENASWFAVSSTWHDLQKDLKLSEVITFYLEFSEKNLEFTQNGPGK